MVVGMPIIENPHRCVVGWVGVHGCGHAYGLQFPLVCHSMGVGMPMADKPHGYVVGWLGVHGCGHAYG